MHAPVSTFEHKGKQYLLAFSAGNALIGSARGDSVWLFGLEGTLPPAAPGAPVSRLAATPAPRADTTTTTSETTPRGANLAAGQQLYEQACVICHGADGRGGHGGGAPLVGVRDFSAVIQTVTAGRNDMPPFRSSLTSEQIRDVSAYVVEALAAGAAR
jgi:mono/diheme cytochrome c family protein